MTVLREKKKLSNYKKQFAAFFIIEDVPVMFGLAL